MGNVLLTDGEWQALVRQYGAKETMRQIDDLSTYISSTGKQYQSHYATLLRWMQREAVSCHSDRTVVTESEACDWW